MRHSARTGGLILSMVGAAASASLLIAQTEPALPLPAEPAAPTPAVTLDLAALVSSPDVFADRVEDPVWQLEAQPGRRLMQVPMRVTPPTSGAAVELERPVIDVRGGRFIAWRIVPAQEQDVPARASDMRMPQDERGWRGMLLMDGNDFDMAGQRPQPARHFDAASRTGGIPDGAPRLTRELTVRADGTIQWELERAVPGATVQDASDGYALKLRRELLAELEPQRPEAVAAGDDLRAAQQKRREDQIAYRNALREFRDLRDRVRDLPETFATPLPPRLWAVFEVRENLSELTFTGPDDSELLPWAIRFASLEVVREVASGRGGGGSGPLEGEMAQHVEQLAGLAQQDHPLTHRAIALALREAGVVGRVQLNGSLYQLLQTIIDGPDAEARRLVVIGLASTAPPTAATASLLREAARHVSPELQLISLRGLFRGFGSRGGGDNPTQLSDMLTNVNRALMDEQGPGAGLVLEAMVEGTQPERGEAGAPDAALIAGVNFDGLPPARLDQAIAYVIRAAGTRPLAAAWLNHRLLGSGNPEVSRRTLELLSRAGGRAGVLKPIGRGLVALVSREAQDGASAPPLDLAISGVIPIESTGHGLFRGINSGDPAVREMAWRALPNFRLGDPSRRREQPGGGAAGSGDDVVTLLMTAALSQDPTPTAIASFFAGQEDDPRATRGLVEVVLMADPAAAGHAARSMVGSGRDLAGALRTLHPGQRAEFAGQLYHAVQDHAPLVTGLLADPQGDRVVQWFGEQVAAGTLPEPTAWAAQYRGDEALLQLAASADPRLAAGAVAAMVAAAGGDEDAAQEIAQRFAAASDRSVGGLTAAWTPAKKDIYARRLATSAGTYRLVVRVDDSRDPRRPSGPPPAFDAGAAPQAMAGSQVITVGIVELTVDGQSVYLGNQTVNFTLPQEHLALRLAARDLKNLPNQELAALPLERLLDPVDLLPQGDGSWQGEAMMPDGSGVTITLQPVAER